MTTHAQENPDQLMDRERAVITTIAIAKVHPHKNIALTANTIERKIWLESLFKKYDAPSNLSIYVDFK